MLLGEHFYQVDTNLTKKCKDFFFESFFQVCMFNAIKKLQP